jgi:hypothetical protein
MALRDQDPANPGVFDNLLNQNAQISQRERLSNATRRLFADTGFKAQELQINAAEKAKADAINTRAKLNDKLIAAKQAQQAGGAQKPFRPPQINVAATPEGANPQANIDLGDPAALAEFTSGGGGVRGAQSGLPTFGAEIPTVTDQTRGVTQNEAEQRGIPGTVGEVGGFDEAADLATLETETRTSRRFPVGGRGLAGTLGFGLELFAPEKNRTTVRHQRFNTPTPGELEEARQRRARLAQQTEEARLNSTRSAIETVQKLDAEGVPRSEIKAVVEMMNDPNVTHVEIADRLLDSGLRSTRLSEIEEERAGANRDVAVSAARRDAIRNKAADSTNMELPTVYGASTRDVLMHSLITPEQRGDRENKLRAAELQAFDKDGNLTNKSGTVLATLQRDLYLDGRAIVVQDDTAADAGLSFFARLNSDNERRSTRHIPLQQFTIIGALALQDELGLKSDDPIVQDSIEDDLEAARATMQRWGFLDEGGNIVKDELSPLRQQQLQGLRAAVNSGYAHDEFVRMSKAVGRVDEQTEILLENELFDEPFEPFEPLEP